MNLYTTDEFSSPRHSSHHFNCTKLTAEEKLALDRLVTREAIKGSIFSFKPFKAPGPDDLHPIFFHKFWDTVGPSTSSLILGISRLRKMPMNINATLVCLIPKVTRLESIHQFWPIGLCNTLYKMVTKILVLCLKPLLNNLIHPL